MSGVLHGVLASLAGAAKDAFFKYVTLLLPGNGTNGAQNNTFIDGSTNNFTITRNGNTTQGTFTPYGSNWSNYFDGTGDYLTVADNAALDMGSSNFTIEGWYYPLGSASLSTAIFSKRANSSTVGGVLLYYGSTGLTPSLLVDIGGSWAINTASSVSFVANQWNHFAVVRNGSAFDLYINGVSGVSASNAGSIPDNASAFAIGAMGADGSGPISVCYISNVRVVKGTAVYTAAFTPPTSPLTAITNTSLLTCQSNRFVDNSTNAFTITPNGDVSVQRFSPFSPTDAYSTSVIGGSGYFDETGDYLTVPASTNMSLGTGDFTIECWVRFAVSTVGNGQGIYQLSNGYLNSVVRGPGLGVENAVGDWTIYHGTTFTQSGIVPTAGVWYHTALVRSSTTTKLYVDGTSIISVADTTNYTDQYFVVGGWYSTGFLLNGYISSLRVVKGTAVYTSNFTPPTSPLTAITNTQLLLNFTNAAIIDNAMLNDLETVGGAQISTAQSKFGGSSLYFDGTGDYLVSNPASTDLYAFGSGDFTIEFWLRLDTTPASDCIIYDSRPLSTSGFYPTLYHNSGQIRYFTNSADRITGSTLSTGVWYHIALARSGTSTRLFVDGTQVGSTYSDSNVYINGSQRPVIATSGVLLAFNMQGYIDDLRITKGYARYTANFTPPAQAFPTS